MIFVFKSLPASSHVCMYVCMYLGFIYLLLANPQAILFANHRFLQAQKLDEAADNCCTET